jgi:hypothetical protein
MRATSEDAIAVFTEASDQGVGWNCSQDRRILVRSLYVGTAMKGHREQAILPVRLVDRCIPRES